MADVVSLNRNGYLVDDGNESKVIICDLADIPGGRALNMEGFDADVVRAGHIIKRTVATDSYAPLGVSGDAYVEAAEGEEIVGVLKVSVTKERPAAAITTMGQVNAAASPYPVTDAIKAALPQIKFLYA